MTSLSLPPRWLAAIIAVAACSGPGPGASPDAAGPDAAGPDAADPDAAMDAALDAAVDAAPDAPDPVPMPLDLELGHQAGVTSIQRTATRVLTVDPGHHWALWDPTTRALIAKGDRACPVSQGCQEPAALLAGDTVLIRGVPTLEVRSATTGQVLAAIPSQVGLDTPGSGIASDGSYVWANTTAWVRAWSPTGVNRVDVAGNYLASKPAGAPGELRIGAGPAGVGRLERIDVATGARTTALHDGTFLAWSSDGARFVTTTGNLVRVYDGTGALVSSGVLPTLTELGTRGDRLWVRSHPGPDDALDVYPASNLAATPTRITITNGATVVDTPEALGVLFPTGGSLDAISLATLAVTHVGGLPCGLTTFAGGASGWLVGTAGGAVLTGAGSSLGPPLARGKLTSISGTVGRPSTITMLPGDRSRWMTPAAWAAARPLATSSASCCTCPSGSAPWRCRRSASDAPRSRSMVMNHTGPSAPSCEPRSWTRHTAGWLTLRARSSSRRTRSSSIADARGRTSLSATSVRASSSRASNTTPAPPRPSSAVSR